MKKKILATSILLVGLSTNANASGIPNFDAALNAIMSNQYVQQIKQHAETMIAHAKEMSLEKALAEYQKAQDDARESYKMSAEAQLKVDQHNMENAKDFQTIDTCGVTAFSAHVAENECEVEDYANNKADELGGVGPMKKKALKDLIYKEGKTANVAEAAVRRFDRERTKELLSYCESTITDDEYTSGRETVTPCTNSRLLAGITAGKTLTDQELISAEKTIELMIYTDGHMPNSNLDPYGDVADLRRYAFQNLAASSLTDIVSMHKKLGGGKSVMGALDDLIKEQTGSVDGIINSEIINESHTGSSTKYTAQAMRTLLYMQNLQLQQNNKIQALLAADLALQIQGL